MIVDCDVHNMLPSRDALKPYLPRAWHEAYESLHVFPYTAPYDSRPQPNGPWRADATPPSGSVPGSDLDFLREQLLDGWNVSAAILSGLGLNGWPAYGELGLALTRALNDWNAAEWLSQDPRLYGSIAVPIEDARLAVSEIERLADHERFVQVLFLTNTREPLGHPKYHPVFEAAAAAGLPVMVHVGGNHGPITGVGWPAYYFEQRTSFVGAVQAHFVSLIQSGLLERVPQLRVVWVETTFAWMPALMWRLDRSWRLLHGDREGSTPPSDLIRRHFWMTTQPMDVVEDPRHFMQMLRHLDMDDRILFATDYPHWDTDSPERAFPPAVGSALKQKFLGDNARALFRFDA
jgi:predicted TIM-barrel fold metal-dependent hydrolase